MQENGFTFEAINKTAYKVVFFGRDITVPNSPKHQQILRLHDLHHVITGYGTCHVGEGELAMWEWRAGVFELGAWATFLTVVTGMMGFVIDPGRMVRAWRASKGARPLWASKIPYPELLEKSVGELRAQANVAPAGLADQPRLLHKNAPKAEPLAAAS
jgi:hypothetical protein